MMNASQQGRNETRTARTAPRGGLIRLRACALLAGLAGLTGRPAPAHADDCLDAYVEKLDLDALNAKAANDLSHAQARDLILYLIREEQITLPTGNGWSPLFNASCEIVPGPLKSPSASNRLAIVNKVGDAKFLVYEKNANRTGTPSTPKLLFNLQPRMVVGLHRLVSLLNGSKHNLRVYEIFTTGIAAVTQGDHKDGVAIDFAGVKGENISGRDTRLFVEDDWGKKPVPHDEDDTVPGRWARTVTETEYRLDADDANTEARDVFRAVHDFFAREFAGCPGNEIATKCSTDRLKHPDYPISSKGAFGREAHFNHIHAGMRP